MEFYSFLKLFIGFTNVAFTLRPRERLSNDKIYEVGPGNEHYKQAYQQKCGDVRFAHSLSSISLGIETTSHMGNSNKLGRWPHSFLA